MPPQAPGSNGAYWLRLHLATFDDPRWLVIESFPEMADTVEIIYVRLLILAGRCNAGGTLVLPDGRPYSDVELAAVLRRQLPTARAAIEMLERYGFVEWVGEPPTLLLPAWAEQDVDALALLAERRDRDAKRKREKRSKNKELPASADVSTDNPRNVRAQNHHHSQMYDDDTALRTQYRDTTPLLIGIPPHEAGKLRPLIEAALQVGHSLKSCQVALDDARRGATDDRPWYGLGQHKLRELAAEIPPPAPVVPAEDPDTAKQRQAEDELHQRRRDAALSALRGMPPDIQQMLQAEARRAAHGIGPMEEWTLVEAVERYMRPE